jgi:diguanylate cyclase (GGDEF)-like protein
MSPELALEVVDLALATGVVAASAHAYRHAKLPLRRRALATFLVIMSMFAVRELLSVLQAAMPELEGLKMGVEALETVLLAFSALAIYWVIRSQRLEIDALQDEAQTDGLTSLNNAAFFRRVGAIMMERALRENTPLALIMLDIDRFKSYNDAHGHEAGNQALQAVARALRDTVRAGDLLARYGGEEFVVVVAGSAALAARAAERLRQAVETRCSPGHDRSIKREITVSAGVAAADASTRTIEDLVEAADKELYRAKQTGRNRVCQRLVGGQVEADKQQAA